MRMITAMIAGTALAACGQSEPRSLQYFELHLDEARKIVAGCESGAIRGEECATAGTAVKTAEARDKFKRFRGK